MDDARFPPHHLGIDVTVLAEDIGASPYRSAAGKRLITGVAPISRAGEQDLSVFQPSDALDQLDSLQAAAIICPQAVAPMVPAHCVALVSPSPLQSFATAVQLLYPEVGQGTDSPDHPTVSKHAYIDTHAVLESDRVTVAEGAVIAHGAHIGTDTTIGPGAVIGPGCQIGRGCCISAHVTVQNALIGNNVDLRAGVRVGEGSDDHIDTLDGPVRIPQIGRVIIQDGVQIGANSTVDRGALEDTVIGDTTKIGSLVSIGSNVRIGRACEIANHVDIADGASINDRAKIRPGARIDNDVDTDWDKPDGKITKRAFRQTD